jgi:hypothetical protein
VHQDRLVFPRLNVIPVARPHAGFGCPAFRRRPEIVAGGAVYGGARPSVCGRNPNLSEPALQEFSPALAVEAGSASAFAAGQRLF